VLCLIRDSCGFRDERRQQTNQQTLRVSRRPFGCALETITAVMTEQQQRRLALLRDFQCINGQAHLPLSQASIPEMLSLSRNHPQEATGRSAPRSPKYDLTTRFYTQPDPSNVYSYRQDRLLSHHTPHHTISPTSPLPTYPIFPFPSLLFSPIAAQATLLDSTLGLSHTQGASRNVLPATAAPRGRRPRDRLCRI
jgi:hypothetical protein